MTMRRHLAYSKEPVSFPPPSGVCTISEAARLLSRMLSRVEWERLRFAERQRLTRVLTRLESDITLAQTILVRTHPGSEEHLDCRRRCSRR